MDDMSRAVSGRKEVISGTILTDKVMDLFRESTMNSLMVHVHEIAESSEANVP